MVAYDPDSIPEEVEGSVGWGEWGIEECETYEGNIDISVDEIMPSGINSMKLCMPAEHALRLGEAIVEGSKKVLDDE